MKPVNPIKKTTNKLDGVFLLDKPTGISSHSAMKRVQRLLCAEKAGHTGSLDPLATGMLPICLGEATKFSRFFLEAKKAYSVKVCWGVTTTTGDREGEILSTAPAPVLSQDELTRLSIQFLGQQQQIPPMFSALKHQGKPLYRLARAGKTVEREPRWITVDDLVFHDSITFDVTCSKGTYIRSLVEAMGEYLGCGAHVMELRRRWADPFQAYSMQNLLELEALSPPQRLANVLDISTLLEAFMPSLSLSKIAAQGIRRGQAVAIEAETAPAGWVSLLCEGEFLGVGEVEPEGGRVKPKRLVNAIV